MMRIKTIILIFVITLHSTSCSKDDNIPEETNFFQELLAVAVFTSTVENLGGGFATEDETGLVFKPKFNGKITAFTLKLPAEDQEVLITLWDYTTKVKIIDAMINVTAPNVEFIKEISPIPLEKNKEYVISYNSLYGYGHNNTQKIVYPISTKNFIISDFLFNNGSTQTFPNSSISDFSISGDCSFIYQKTE